MWATRSGTNGKVGWSPERIKVPKSPTFRTEKQRRQIGSLDFNNFLDDIRLSINAARLNAP
jgi:hypothetical protein